MTAELHLWEVQGSYFHHVDDHGKGGWRANLRAFVLAAHAETAIGLWHEHVESLPNFVNEPEIHQVIKRTDRSTILLFSKDQP